MTSIKEKIKSIWSNSKVELLIFVGSVIWAGIFSLYVYSLGLTTLLVDQNAHLNIARLISDSITPGISQIGFWPPLIHVLMAPFVSISFFFETGLGGAAALVPIFALGAVFVYRILMILTRNSIISLGGVLMFLTNPFILYYTATPMTETLFVVMLLGVTYYFLLWLHNHTFRALVFLGIFVTLASVARFEGFLLIPIVAILVIAKLLQERKTYHEIEAVSILFGLVAVIGLAFTFIYSWTFGENPLEFINGVWSAGAQQKSFFLPTYGDIGMALLYFVEASKYLIGGFLVSLSLLGFIYLLATLMFDQRLLAFFAITVILLSPFIFDLLALVKGSTVLYVDNLPPFDGYFNERYGIYWFGFAVIVPMFMIAILNERAKKYVPSLKNLTAILLVSFFVGTNAAFLADNAFVNKFAILANSPRGTLPDDQRELATVLREEYDDGKILITRGLQNYATVSAGIPLKNYLVESNFLFYENAMAAPWFFAKWVVMYNPNIEGIEDWRREQERVSMTWADSPIFESYYDLVFENGSERLYKLRENKVKRNARTLGIELERIPSLNPEQGRWDIDFANNEIIERAEEELNMRNVAIRRN